LGHSYCAFLRCEHSRTYAKRGVAVRLRSMLFQARTSPSCGTIEGMSSPAVTPWIAEQAHHLGFSLCGVVAAERFAELGHFQEWLARGYAGEMKYLEDPRRRDPGAALDGVRSTIVCGLNYNTAYPYSTQVTTNHDASDIDSAANDAIAPRGWISRYAWGGDYHEVLWEKLNALLDALREQVAEPFSARAYADTGPVSERILAKYAGLGWLGKNTLLLNQSQGSFFFLGVILTSLDLEPSIAPAQAPPPDLCGSCRKCIDACPTDALVEPYVMDARRCISYLTIELRGSIPLEFREAIGNNVYGCDICQDVCPHNRKAPTTAPPDFQPRQTPSGESLFQPHLEWIAGLTEEEFREAFRGSAMKRAKWRGLVRNACIALGNAKLERASPAHPRIKELLQHLANHAEASIAESAQWALARIQ
jgi:epoxyqueuosine reductase